MNWMMPSSPFCEKTRNSASRNRVSGGSARIRAIFKRVRRSLWRFSFRSRRPSASATIFPTVPARSAPSFKSDMTGPRVKRNPSAIGTTKRPKPGTESRNRTRGRRRWSLEDRLGGTDHAGHLVIAHAEAAGDVEAAAGDDLGNRQREPGEQAHALQHRLFVHRPEEGAGADPLLGEAPHRFLGIEGHLGLKHDRIDPVDVLGM